MNPRESVSVGLVVKEIRAGGMTKLDKRLKLQRRHVELTGFTRISRKNPEEISREIVREKGEEYQHLKLVVKV